MKDEILNSTQLVGVSNIKRHKNAKLRIIWFFVIASSILLCGYHVSHLISQYAQRDTSLNSASKLNDTINFPALELRWSARGNLNRSAANYSMEVTNCKFREEDCNFADNFTKFTIQAKERHGHVYIFNSAMGAEQPSYGVAPSTKARFDVQLKLKRNNDSTECIRQLVENDAFTFNVAIEPPALYLYGADSSEETKWIPLHHNWYTQVRVHVTSIRRLGKPFNNCQLKYTDEAAAVMHYQISTAMYSLNYCKKVCEHSGQYAHCGCIENNKLADIELFNQTLPRCTEACTKYTEDDKKECRDNCLPPCEEEKYETSYSWSNIFYKENCDYMMYHLEISYPSTGLYTILEEQERYPLEEFLAEASGLLNFYLGFSLAVVAEVGILIAGYFSKDCKDTPDTVEDASSPSEANKKGLRGEIYGSKENIVPPRGFMMTPVIDAFSKLKRKKHSIQPKLSDGTTPRENEEFVLQTQTSVVKLID